MEAVARRAFNNSNHAGKRNHETRVHPSCGAGMPTVLAMSQSLATAQNSAGQTSPVTRKAEPLDCSKYFTASAVDFGPRDSPRG